MVSTSSTGVGRPSLDGKVVLITGTAGGMGASAARLFAEAGATVVGCDIKPTDGSDPVDLTDEDAVRRWVDAAAAAHGGIDVLYANAGATRFGPLEQITKQDWEFNLRTSSMSCSSRSSTRGRT